jgi:hypothetical protein
MAGVWVRYTNGEDDAWTLHPMASTYEWLKNLAGDFTDAAESDDPKRTVDFPVRPLTDDFDDEAPSDEYDFVVVKIAHVMAWKVSGLRDPEYWDKFSRGTYGEDWRLGEGPTGPE